MKVSTKGRYGLRAMLEIALGMSDGPVTRRTIAERQDITERYLEQLLIPLKKAGLIMAVRGPRGGYVLNKDPGKITAGDVIRVLEGPIAPVECVSDIDTEGCSRAEYCTVRKVWSQVTDSINKVLDSYTLEDLLLEVRKQSRMRIIDTL